MNKQPFTNLFKGHNKNITRKLVSGFTIIEVLVACSIISISMFALMQTASKGLRLSIYALNKSQASLLLEEGAEAVKSIRDNNWATINGLSLNTPHYLFFNTSTKLWTLDSANTVSLSGHIPTYPIDGVFRRTVVVEPVCRDSNDDILDSCGILTPDLRTKKINVNVTWSLFGVLETKSLSLYISDIFN